MKIYRLIGITAITVLCGLTLLGGISHSGVKGSKHDLSYDGGSAWEFSTEQVCVFCHTPHGGNTQVVTITWYNATTDPASYENSSNTGSLLMWNRSLANATSYSTYQSATMDASTSQVRAYSLLCMSCHDGVGAMNVLTNYPNESWGYWGGNPYAGPPGGGLTVMSGPDTRLGAIFDGDPPLGWGANIGERVVGSDSGDVNLANDHPVSFDYTTTHPDVLAGGLEGPNNTFGYVKVQEVRLFPNPSNELKSVECSTCHDPHNEGTGDQSPFLVMSNAGSALCKNCHKK
jgi:predicted CXXCH cytochrome family protein